MASQPSDRLKAILAEARARAAASRDAAVAAPNRETRRMEALLDRNEDLPDSRALARMYREKALVERLPGDDDQAMAAPQAEAAPQAPTAPPLSPAQIRDVMNELRVRFTGGEYATFEPRPLPDDVIPFADEPEEDGPPPPAEPREVFYVIGSVVAILVIGVFVLLAVNGPLRYHAPAAGPSPRASASR